MTEMYHTHYAMGVCLAAKQTKNQSSGAVGPHSVEYTTAFLNTRTLQNVLSINYI